MRCFTLENGIVSPGIQLWRDADKCFVHVRPDVWMPVHPDLLNCASPEQIEHRADDQIILHRASTRSAGPVEFIAETADSAGRACVLGHFGLDVVRFTDRCPAPPVPYRTCLGMNFWTGQVMAANRITHDRLGEGAVRLAHEEYSFVVGMDVDEHVDVQVLFYPAGDGLPRGQIEPWVEGAFLRYDGENVLYNQLEARTMEERWAAARVYHPARRAA